MANIIECRNLTKYYKDLCALSHVNVAIPDRGGIIGLLGPNGSGKTTFIKLLTGLLAPTEGDAQIGGYPIGTETKYLVSYLSDAHSLNESISVTQQLDYFVDFFPDFDRQKAQKMIAELGINENQKIKTLSKGTKEKLSLILTLSRNAKVFILDEPIAGVDPAARDYILRTILSHKLENSTMIISTHLISEIEEYLDYVLFLKNGCVVLSGETEEIRQREGKTIDALFREVFKWM
ncbi:MAG: ABC transporter ATP-binding protein [Clostridiales bacterium]|jgi:ABC-2 type transport system ATP-binding protein|nr:ABC transporter ATP-binding protein [Clostridiales bacterium]